MLLGNNLNSANSTHNHDFEMQLINSGRYAESYSLLKKERNTNISGLYNMGLCLMYGQLYTDAIQILDQALISITASNNLPEDSTYRNIISIQNQRNIHRNAVNEDYVSRFSTIVKDNLLRLKIDCYLALQQWSNVIELSSIISNKDYSNVEEACAIAKRNII